MENMRILHDNDADLSVLNGKTIAVIGYGSQGRAQSLCMRDSGLNVIVGVRPGKSFDAAVQDGFKVLSVAQAAEEADIIHILLPEALTSAAMRPGTPKPSTKRLRSSVPGLLGAIMITSTPAGGTISLKTMLKPWENDRVFPGLTAGAIS